MMIGPSTFREAYENATIDEIIKKRDKLIKEIRRYEKGKIPVMEYSRRPSHKTVYMMSNLYLAELCYLINEKNRETEEY